MENDANAALGLALGPLANLLEEARAIGARQDRARTAPLLKRAAYCLGYLKAPDDHPIDRGCGCHRCELLVELSRTAGVGP